MSRHRWAAPAAALILLALFAGFEPATVLLGSLVKILTEGNSLAKQAVFLILLCLYLFKRAVLSMPVFVRERKWLASKATLLFRLLAVFIFLGFFAGLALQLFVQSSLGGGFHSYVSLVTDCRQSACWEATYFQHIHLMKSGMYFFEKNTGLFLPPNTDDGQPMYELLASRFFGIADTVSLLSLFLLAAIAVFALAAALAESSPVKGFWVFLAGAVSLFALLDGGFFSLAGTAAFTLVLLVVFDRFPLGRFDALKPLMVLLVSLAVSRLPFLLLGTNLYFREWLLAPFFVCSVYLFLRQYTKRNVLFVVACGLLTASSLLVLSETLHYASGDDVPAGTFFIYGLPLSVADARVEQATGARVLARYGWYALMETNASFNPSRVASWLRAALSPKGYLLAEATPRASNRAEASIIWLSAPVELSDTWSYRDISGLQSSQLWTVTGNSTLASPQLAMELGSFIRSEGGKAVVVTNVV